MPSACSVSDDDRAEPGDVLGALRQRAIADHRVLRIGEDVEDRRVVERDADRRQLGRERAGEPRGERLVAAPSERRHRRPPVNGRLSRATRPPSWSTLTHSGSSSASVLRLARDLGDLLRLVDVAGEEDDAAEIELAGQRPELRRYRMAGESRDRQLADVTSNVA